MLQIGILDLAKRILTQIKHQSPLLHLPDFIVHPKQLQLAMSQQVQIMMQAKENLLLPVPEILLSHQGQSHFCLNLKFLIPLPQNQSKLHHPTQLPLSNSNNMDFLSHSKFNKCQGTKVEEVVFFLHYRNHIVLYMLHLLSLRLVIVLMMIELVQ